VKEKRKITNRGYRKLNAVSNKTAYIELGELVQRGVLIPEGTGKALRYVLSKGNVKVTHG